MPKPIAVLAKTVAEHAGHALRQYAAGDRLSCSLSPISFAELEAQGGYGTILTLQLSGECIEFSATSEGQPIDVIQKQHLIGPGPSRARPLVRAAFAFSVIARRSARAEICRWTRSR
ncbi:hypothetical protein GR268_26760 [Rhizobium leguminosarum]|uniref:hypothetical protein n=1 Tax=Rhizobium leguminosarum TaxID=384 RepID=UPI0013F15B3E|nr:hypothetical protein [Rhizobium leguminosarum]